MDSVFKDSLKKLKRTEFEMINDGHHSSKDVVLGHAVSGGRFSDTEYLNTTLPVMVECLFCPGSSPQPIIFCLVDTLAEVKGACIFTFAQDENLPVAVEVIWANNGLQMAVGPQKLSERNVKATLRMLKARAGVDVSRVHSEKSSSDLKDSDEALAI